MVINMDAKTKAFFEQELYIGKLAEERLLKQGYRKDDELWGELMYDMVYDIHVELYNIAKK